MNKFIHLFSFVFLNHCITSLDLVLLDLIFNQYVISLSNTALEQLITNQSQSITNNRKISYSICNTYMLRFFFEQLYI